MTTMPVYEMVDTWNAAGTVFTAIGMNVTDNLSASGSMLIDLQVGGTSQFHVTKSGSIHGKRSNYNIASANASIVSVSNYSLTGSNADSLMDLAGTWNTSGTPTALKLNVTDTASAAGSLLMDLQVGGTSLFSISKAGIAKFVDRASTRDMRIEPSITGLFHRFFSSNTGAGYSFETSSTVLATLSATTGVGIGSGTDLFLIRDAANTLAQRNGTNAQTFRLYNTFTDASNYERGKMEWASNALRIGTEKAGTGTARALELQTDGTTRLTIGATTGHVFATNDVYCAAGAFFGPNGRSMFSSPSDGVMRISNYHVNDFNRLQFGGTTSSFPSLKRSTTSLQVRLADDSADAPLTAGRITAQTLTVGLGGQTAVATNTALGFEALNSASLTGQDNVGVGYRALLSNTTGVNNSAVGVNALYSNTTGSNNSAMGRDALVFNTTGASNSAVGTYALYSNTTGVNNSAMGVSALLNNTTGVSNSAVGLQALLSNTTGTNNSAMGVNALPSNTTGASNSAVGVNALYSNTTGSENIAMGREAGRRFAGSNNTMLGRSAGVNISRGVNALGAITGGSAYTDGTYNGVTLTRSSGSNFDGAPTANITVSGGAVTAVTLVTAGTGFQSTDTVLTAPAASIGGTGSGWSVVVSSLTGAVSSDNTLIGYQAGDNLTEGSRNVIIGSNIDADSTTGSDQINIADRYYHNRIRLIETTDPAAPAADNAVIFCRDNGSGKTQICVRFPTGAVQVIATEP